MMENGDYYVRVGLRPNNTELQGKIYNQFMMPEQETSSVKKKKEERVRLGGYEASVGIPAKSRTEVQSPMAGYSEFWIG